MGFLMKLFRRKVDDRSVESEQPLWDLGRKIVLATTSCYEATIPSVKLSDDKSRNESEGAILFQYLFFFTHLVTREASACGWKPKEIGKLQHFLRPRLASVTIDSIYEGVSAEQKAGMIEALDQQFILMEDDFGSSTTVFSEDSSQMLDSASGKLAGTISTLCGYLLDQAVINRVIQQVTEQYQEMRLPQALKEAQAALASM